MWFNLVVCAECLCVLVDLLCSITFDQKCTNIVNANELKKNTKTNKYYESQLSKQIYYVNARVNCIHNRLIILMVHLCDTIAAWLYIFSLDCILYRGKFPLQGTQLSNGLWQSYFFPLLCIGCVSMSVCVSVRPSVCWWFADFVVAWSTDVDMRC